ncbi:hypothetical protein HK098_002876 [Nowakowskiella sp. JEL0407]|nr:hypothetical protein HK098_002876 [Nowakowskiella sp. JEL0407]
MSPVVLQAVVEGCTALTAVSYAYGLISYNLIISVVFLQLLINGKEGIGPRVDGVPPSVANVVGISLQLILASGQIVWLRMTYSDLEKEERVNYCLAGLILKKIFGKI